MNKLKRKVALALGSRTFWTIVLLVLLNTLPEIKNSIPAKTFDLINTIVGVIATYFHVSPRQDYQSES